MTNADQSPSEAQDPEPTAHAYDAPGLSPKQFLLRVMHAPDAAIRDRVRAASELLRLYPHDWDPPRLKYIIGGIPHRHSLSTESSPAPTMERTGNGSQKTARPPPTTYLQAKFLRLKLASKSSTKLIDY